MSSVRVLVGTRKGAFVLTADGKRKDWTVSGPFFAGWEIYHLKGSPVDPIHPVLRAPSATTAPASAAPSCVFSPAKKIGRTSRSTPRSPSPLPPVASRC